MEATWIHSSDFWSPLSCCSNCSRIARRSLPNFLNSPGVVSSSSRGIGGVLPALISSLTALGDISILKRRQENLLVCLFVFSVNVIITSHSNILPEWSFVGFGGRPTQHPSFWRTTTLTQRGTGAKRLELEWRLVMRIVSNRLATIRARQRAKKTSGETLMWVCWLLFSSRNRVSF